ncbi:uncharacterized protein LOC134802459 [Cydia splendana]|uniref:uncharacterized protein LOC134802459 n=1 Tax=Cydia splendana TaxID=1100963 RepID=UPI0028F47CCC
MKFLTLGLLLLCGAPLTAPRAPNKPGLRLQSHSKDWIRKEISAIIHMTLEFVKDMDMKMRDVRRIERNYYGTYDFGAARIFSAIGNKFDHMCALYKNTSRVPYIIEQERDLRSEVVGMLQFMLSDYDELQSLIDLFKERFKHWRQISKRYLDHEIIKKYLISQKVFPSRWNFTEEMEVWR